jgi:NAD(P)-dependent dehydrogenase (short-subunit alcohol dehydrogenase family)
MKGGMKDLFSLQGKIALVTGGSRGIGKMIAEGFLRQGATVYITSRKVEACLSTVKELSQHGDIRVLPMDVSTVAGAKGLAAAYNEKHDKLDILVNNAGAAWGWDFDTFPESGWDKVIDLNLKAPFFLTQSFAPLLRAAGTPERLAKVINITSVDGFMVNPLETYSYGASKAGLVHMTKRMSLRLIRDNIAVSSIAPGAFASDMNRMARDDGDKVAQTIPAKRIGRDEDMAGAAVYLASRAGDYVVGQTLIVDGGISIVHADFC